jgi:hypothetical protein
MAAKGSILKKEVSEKILKAFPGSFLYNDGKEIRINGLENGERLQIKVTLTAAKVAVEGGEDVALPGSENAATADVKPAGTNEQIPQEPSAEEKERLAMLLNQLGLS